MSKKNAEAAEVAAMPEATEEIVGTPEATMDLPEAAATPEAEVMYPMNDGTMGKRAAFIREKFLDDNMGRKQISEEFEIPYRVVYSATVNMHNTADPATRGRSAANAVIQLTSEGAVVVKKGDVIMIDGEIFEGTAEDLPDLTDANRNDYIREQVAAGVSRGELAKKLDMSYGVIYGMTKDSDQGRTRIEVELADGTKVSRADYIRLQVAAGMSRSDIAKELNVPYSVVWQATKVTKTEADKLQDAVAALAAFRDSVTDISLFDQILAALATVQVIVPEVPEAPAEVEPSTEAPGDFAE